MSSRRLGVVRQAVVDLGLAAARPGVEPALAFEKARMVADLKTASVEYTKLSGQFKELEETIASDRRARMSFNCGRWESVIERRDEMLARSYPHTSIAKTDVTTRMDCLKADLLDALRTLSAVRRNQLPVALAAKTSAVSDPQEIDRAFRLLVDAIARASLVTDLHRVETWLRDRKLPCPINTDLTWLAVAELNANRADGQLPFILVLPNYDKLYCPLFVHAANASIADNDTAEFLRDLFSR